MAARIHIGKAHERREGSRFVTVQIVTLKSENGVCSQAEYDQFLDHRTENGGELRRGFGSGRKMYPTVEVEGRDQYSSYVRTL